MTMPSDILIVFKIAPSETEMSRAKACLMGVDHSVLVHHKDGSKRVLLVKFNPQDVSPTILLEAVRNAGFDVSMAGG